MSDQLYILNAELRAQLIKAKLEMEALRKDAERYGWLVSKIFARGETCLALYEEFGGPPYKDETIVEFMNRYIDAALKEGEGHD